MKEEIYHVEIQVSNLEESVELYDEFLGWLGYQRIYEHKMGVGWGLGPCNFWAFQRLDKFTQHWYHRRRGGLNHIAFHADSGGIVDKFYNRYLLPKKIPVLYGGPKDYTEYLKGYYSVYFEDPDRTKLELAHVPVFKGSVPKPQLG